MSAEASKKALEMSGISPEEIDMIILSTASPNAVVPCVACQVQEMIGAKNAVCYDLNAACSGFVYAYCHCPGLYPRRDLQDHPDHRSGKAFPIW